MTNEVTVYLHKKLRPGLDASPHFPSNSTAFQLQVVRGHRPSLTYNVRKSFAALHQARRESATAITLEEVGRTEHIRLAMAGKEAPDASES